MLKIQPPAAIEGTQLFSECPEHGAGSRQIHAARIQTDSAQRLYGTIHDGGFWKIPDVQQRITCQGAIRMRCRVSVLYLYMMDFRSQKKIQETKLFRRNVASADCTSHNTVRFYAAGKVCQRAEAANKDR